MHLFVLNEKENLELSLLRDSYPMILLIRPTWN